MHRLLKVERLDQELAFQQSNPVGEEKLSHLLSGKDGKVRKRNSQAFQTIQFSGSQKKNSHHGIDGLETVAVMHTCFK